MSRLIRDLDPNKPPQKGTPSLLVAVVLWLCSVVLGVAALICAHYGAVLLPLAFGVIAVVFLWASVEAVFPLGGGRDE